MGAPEPQSRRSRLRGFLASHRRLIWAGFALLIALITFVLLWFEPQKLFINDSVNEPIPQAAATRDATQDEADDESVSEDTGMDEEKTEPERLAAGDFQSLEHSTTGSAVLLELADGRQFLRFEDLDTSNGPDLRVYLSEIPASDDWHAYGERYEDLGALKGNIGDQNYVLPEGLDLSRFKSAVIWCRRFRVGFGVAPLDGLEG